MSASPPSPPSASAASPARRAFTPSGRTLAVAVVAFAVAVALSAAGRYGLVENTAMGHACDAGETSLRCTVRATVDGAFRSGLPGYLAAAAGFWCLVRPSSAAFVLTLFLAGLGLILFNAWPAGLALTLALMSLARPGGPVPLSVRSSRFSRANR